MTDWNQISSDSAYTRNALYNALSMPTLMPPLCPLQSLSTTHQFVGDIYVWLLKGQGCCMYHHQQNRCYPQSCLLAHFEATLDFGRSEYTCP